MTGVQTCALPIWDNAANTKKEAELNAQQIVEQAHKEILTVKFEYLSLKRDLATYKFKMESIINSQLKLMDSIDDEQLVEDSVSALESASALESNLDLEA